MAFNAVAASDAEEMQRVSSASQISYRTMPSSSGEVPVIVPASMSTTTIIGAGGIRCPLGLSSGSSIGSCVNGIGVGSAKAVLKADAIMINVKSKISFFIVVVFAAKIGSTQEVKQEISFENLLKMHFQKVFKRNYSVFKVRLL